MSKRLKETIDGLIQRCGGSATKAKAQIAAALDCHFLTVERWMRDGVPSADEAYRVALACGCTEQEALAVASEDLQERAKKTA